jgi:hypothetical protein
MGKIVPHTGSNTLPLVGRAGEGAKSALKETGWCLAEGAIPPPGLPHKGGGGGRWMGRIVPHTGWSTLPLVGRAGEGAKSALKATGWCLAEGGVAPPPLPHKGGGGGR